MPETATRSRARAEPETRRYRADRLASPAFVTASRKASVRLADLLHCARLSRGHREVAWTERGAVYGGFFENYRSEIAAYELDKLLGLRMVLPAAERQVDGVRRVLDLLMQLEAQALASRGRVVVLLGNHEVMNLVGETRDVTPEVLASFADERSEARRVAACATYAALAQARDTARPTDVSRQGREEWTAAHPPGFLEYREALGPNGRYGRWLRGHPIAARIEGAILMHAGVSPDAAPRDLEDLNRRARDEIQRFDRYVARLVDRGPALPFFTLQEILTVSAAEVGALLDRHRARVLVLGHTPSADGRIRRRFGGRVFLIDTGMLASHYPGGRPAALEIDGASVTAVHLDDRVPLVRPHALSVHGQLDSYAPTARSP